MSASLTHQPPASAGATFVRVGIAGPTGRADLAVPTAVPLIRLMPALLRHAGQEPGPDGGVRHGGWVLRRADGTRLDTVSTLAAQDVREGDLLFIGHGTDDTTPPLYDDIAEVIGRDGVRVPWPTAATRWVTGSLATLAMLTACAALDAAPGRLPGWLGLATALFALAVGVLMSRAFADSRAGAFAAVLAAPPAMLGAVRLLGGGTGILGGSTAGQLLLACGVLAVVGAVGPLLIGGGDGTFATLVVTGPLAATGALVCALWDVHPARAAAITAPLALALTTLWPTVALRLARIPAPHVAATVEELEELPSQLEHDRLRARIAVARRLLLGMQVGSHLVAGGGALVLFGSTRLWPGVLGTVLVLLMLTRARLFKDTAQVAIPLATALLAVAGAAAAFVDDRFGETVPTLGVALPIALLTALVTGTIGLFAGRTRLNPRVSRAIDVLETTLLLSVVPLCLAVWEVYSALLDLRA
ncbi:type VII secretion integral membrane protein EccD [Streptomyces litchfieldiae]|uniref:Type VII secretion integral membrane protein EccD n=1 Tax=Streptomyces litchfieldiae TaxID=3075543 RepID=A0ABU2N1Q8_9ACTN|nr:type VII secretion integral membrane protein EccD [Streptomyces sp. DSM 44938]MDT0347686.1 type VII secretion integral membrane protein EccD [Streptomyces sp. DSM 44938]